MKLNSASLSSLRRLSGAAILAGVLLSAGAAMGRGSFDSPAGTLWDCVMSGPREGLAQMLFFAPSNSTSAATFAIEEILVPKPRHIPDPNDDSRGTGGNDSRGFNNSTNSTSLPPHTDIFGWEGASGQWGLDSRGRVIGYFYEITQPVYTFHLQTLGTSNFTSSVAIAATNGSPQAILFSVTQPLGSATNWLEGVTSYTNFVGTNGLLTSSQLGSGSNFISSIPITQTTPPDAPLQTNVTYSVTLPLSFTGFWTNQTTFYSNYVTAVAITNQVSFVSTVAPGRRLSLLASTPGGKVTFSGVPDVPQADISGRYYGSKRVGFLQYYEFFTLTAEGDNAYSVTGQGPGYTYSGMAFLFPQNKIAIVLGVNDVFPAGLANNPIPQRVRSVVGPFNGRRMSGTLHGLEGTSVVTSADDQRFNFAIHPQ
jgi:hypothetical protein